MNTPTAIFNNNNEFLLYSNCGFTDEFMEGYKDCKIVHNMAVINVVTKYTKYEIVTDANGNIINAIPLSEEEPVWR